MSASHWKVMSISYTPSTRDSIQHLTHSGTMATATLIFHLWRSLTHLCCINSAPMTIHWNVAYKEEYARQTSTPNFGFQQSPRALSARPLTKREACNCIGEVSTSSLNATQIAIGRNSGRLQVRVKPLPLTLEVRHFVKPTTFQESPPPMPSVLKPSLSLIFGSSYGILCQPV